MGRRLCGCFLRAQLRPTNLLSPSCLPQYPRLPSLVPIPVLELPSPSLTISISRTPAPPITAIRRISVATKATFSTVSTRVRRLNRSEALARLEGRSRLKVYIKPYQQQQRKFMNMSDDEDEEDQDTDFEVSILLTIYSQIQCWSP